MSATTCEVCGLADAAPAWGDMAMCDACEARLVAEQRAQEREIAGLGPVRRHSRSFRLHGYRAMLSFLLARTWTIRARVPAVEPGGVS